jgi:uncharacterized protein YkwD
MRLTAEPKAAPPAITISRTPEPTRGTAAPAGPLLYSIGDPTDEEQYFLELLNYSRLNPAAQGVALATQSGPDVTNTLAYYKIDPQALATSFSTIPPAPPLSFAAELTTAARGHSRYMLSNVVQTHFEGTNGIGERANAVGYPWRTLGENVYAYSTTVDFGFAAFEIDWGQGPGGIQNPPGHRLNNHSTNFFEIGIGILHGSNSVVMESTTNTVGPQLITMDFGTRQNQPALVTGVAYYDLNGNGRYDLGEGVGGVQVNTDSPFGAVTASAGGYSIPVGSGFHTVYFSYPGFTYPTNVIVTGQNNVKADLRLPFNPTVITGASQAYLNYPNPYTAPAYFGANSYDWRVYQRVSPAPVWSAEAGGPTVVFYTTGSYPIISHDAAEGSATSYHLAAPTQDDQSFELNGTLYGGAAPTLSFGKLFGLATTNQVAQAQVSTDGGQSWTTVWRASGVYLRLINNIVDIDYAFSDIGPISLPMAANKPYKLRFTYTFEGDGIFINTTEPDSINRLLLPGIYLDNIAVGDTSLLIPLSTTTTSSNVLLFTPPAAGTYALQAHANLGARSFPDGSLYVFGTTSQPPPIQMGPAQISALAGGQITVSTTITGTPSSVVLESASTLTGVFSAQNIVAKSLSGGVYQFTVPTGSGQAFFRIRAQ